MADPCIFVGRACKTVGETVRLGVDFAELLTDGETLSDPPTVTASPTGPTISGQDIDGTAAVALVAAGTAATTYKIVFAVTTSEGQTRVRYVSLEIEANP